MTNAQGRRFARPADATSAPGRLRRRARRGMNVFAVLLGLGLTAVAIAGTIAWYNSARETANRTEALALLNQLRTGIESVWSGSPSYGNGADLIPTLDRRGHIPDSARIRIGAVGTVGTPGFAAARTEIRHPFGGLVTIVGGPGGSTNQFRVTFEDVDDEVCAALGDAYADRTRARAGIANLVINGQTLTAPVSIANITTNCDDGAGANDIGFTFG